MKAVATYKDGTSEVLTDEATEQTLTLMRMFAQAVKELATDALKCANEHQRERIIKIVEHL